MPNKNVIITGQSGAGKTSALKSLEDWGYYVLDHIPAQAAPHLVHILKERHERIAIGVDAWDEHLPALMKKDQLEGATLVLLQASNECLLRRYAQTRRRHPLESQAHTLASALQYEQQCVQQLKPYAQMCLDTTDWSASELASQLRVQLTKSAGLKTDICVHIQSFGFKHGSAGDADVIFDARMLPNPYYDTTLRGQSGCDAPVQAFFNAHEKKPLIDAFIGHIEGFIVQFAPHYAHDGRSALRVGIGCTGGQHRSVFVAQTLAQRLEGALQVHCTHRDQAKWHGVHAPSEAPQEQVHRKFKK